MELTFTAGVRAGEHLHLDATLITIGRELDNQVLLPVEGVSRHHARISQTAAEHWELVDLGSANGVKLNGQPIAQPAPLNDGDRVDICGQVFLVSMKPPIGSVIFKPFNEAAAALSPEAAARRAVPAGYDLSGAEDRNPGHTIPLPRHRTVATEPVADDFTRAVRTGDGNLFQGPGTPGTAREHSALIGDGPPPPARRRFSNLFFYVLVVCVAVIVIFGYLAVTSSRAVTETGPVEPTGTELVLLYERERIFNDNVFRYTLCFEGNQAEFILDDLKSRRSFKRVIEALPDDTVRELQKQVENSGFFDLKDQSGRTQVTDKSREKRRILVVTPQRKHDISIINDAPPEAFAEVEAVLQEFADANALQTISMTPEELKIQAEKAYRNAENYYANYSGHPGNLPLAIRSYQLAIEYLEQFSPKPEIYTAAMAKCRELEELRKTTVSALKIECQRLSKMEDYEELRRTLMELKELADPNSRDYDNARKNLLLVEEELRNRSRRR